MRLETKACLDDLLRACNLIQSAISGITVDQFIGNWEKQSAVERQFTIIGETLIRIRNFEPAILDAIPDARAIIGFRNILMHGYDTADPRAVFKLAETRLDGLKEIVDRILAD